MESHTPDSDKSKYVPSGIFLVARGILLSEGYRPSLAIYRFLLNSLGFWREAPKNETDTMP
jgi:hypothetical protein